MKNIPALIAAMLSIGCLLNGCRPAKVESPPHVTEEPATRNNCYSLLHQLLENEKDVSMLRFIKREHSDVKELVKKIAATSGTESKLLEKLAKNDPSMELDATSLPSGEIATRKAIASTKKEFLLGS